MKDIRAFEEALTAITGPLTLWELKQRVDQMVLKFGRDRQYQMMLISPEPETHPERQLLVWRIDGEIA